MELKQYFNILMKRVWLIILLPLVATALSAYVSISTYKPVYAANATLYVISTNVDDKRNMTYGDIMVDQQLVKDYRELIKSRTVTSDVIKDLNIKGIAPEDLAKQIKVSSKNETRLLNIEVVNSSAKMAMKITNKVSEVFVKKATELMKVDNVSIIDAAQTPDTPVQSNVYVKIAIGLFIGLLMAVGIVFLIEYLDDTIKSSEDVEKHLGLTVLGTIPVLNIK